MKPFLFGFSVLVTSLAQGAMPADSWTLVPAFPTGCYGKQDDFDEVVVKNIETLTAEIERQDNSNEEIKGPALLTDSSGQVDPWAMQRQMMENIQKNPQAAMQAVQASNESVAPGRQADEQQEQKDLAQKERLAGLIARYEAALKAATVPKLAPAVADKFPEGVLGPVGDGTPGDT